MGYNLIIGELKVETNCEDDIVWSRHSAKHETNENSPSNCSFTGKGNHRSPSYTAWHEFCHRVGLVRMFYGDEWDTRHYVYKTDFYRANPIIYEHPGAALISTLDLIEVGSALEKYEKQYGNSPDTDHQYDLVRLRWLNFWIDHALKTCKVPVIANS